MKLSTVFIFCFLVSAGLCAEKPVIDWYARTDYPPSFERPHFILMNNAGKNSSVLLLSDWTLLEVEAKRAEGYEKIIGWITEPALSMDHLLDPMNHLQDPKLGPSSWIETHLDRFDLILTFNQYLLEKYPEKCKFINPMGFGTLYDQKIHPKSKLCSHMVSNQRWTEGHQLRWAVAETYPHYFEGYKDGHSTWVEWKDEWLNDFCFSVVVENSRESHYFSEKLVECLRAGTVPIYWGCPTIAEFFDRDGIIVFDKLEDLEPILKGLSFEEYQKRLPAIRRNFELAGKYPQFWLTPCRHKGYVVIDYTKPWTYSIDRPDVVDGIWPYIQSYFDPTATGIYPTLWTCP